MQSVRADSDAALVRRVLAGDAEAYAGLVARYQERLSRYAFRMLGNSADAEEAVQDAFVRGYRSLARCTDAERFGAWLFGIMVNRCRTLGGQRARRHGLVTEDDGAVQRASVAHPEERAALRDAIDRAVAQLKPEQREAFLLKHVEELSYDEMADLTGMSVSALKMRVARARERLQQLLEEDLGV
jgi:RNA polymerase sigma-70 factor (ECF subfamily)